MKAKENLIVLSVTVFFAVVFVGTLSYNGDSADTSGQAYYAEDSIGQAVGEVSCVDTDGGLNSQMAGFVSYTAVRYTTNFPDTCRDTNKLLEYYCEDNHIRSRIVVCDYACSNAACLN